MQYIKHVIDLTNMKEGIAELKSIYEEHRLVKGEIFREAGYTIIELRQDDTYTSPKLIFYGKERETKLYIGRVQHIKSIKDYEFEIDDKFSTGVEEGIL